MIGLGFDKNSIYKENSDMIIFLIPAADVIVLVSHLITIGLLTRTTTHCPRQTSNNQFEELFLYLSLKGGFFQMLPGNYTTTFFFLKEKESCITEKVKLYGKSISQCTTITKSRRHGEDSLPGSERKASEHYLASS